MTQKPYEFVVRAAPYSDGSGYAAEATIEPGDDGAPAVRVDINYRITGAEWADLVKAVDTALTAARERR